MSSPNRTIVIVGGVAGGASAATRARRCNEQAEIILFEKDDYVSFANCGLPYYLGGEIENRENLFVATPQTFIKRYRIDVRTRHEVVGIDRKGHMVSVKNRETGKVFEQKYDKLILAPGANPIVPSLDGMGCKNVMMLRNVADTDRIARYLDSEKPRRAVVVGAGYIGVEMVEQLHRRGLDVSLVEKLEQVMPPLDPEMAHLVQQEIESKGVKVYLGDGLAGIKAKGDTATGVTLESGTEVAADMVIVGVGVKPNTGLAEEAGLQITSSGAIGVNAFMQTSDPDIYAAGDAVEYLHKTADKMMRIPLAGPANRSGRLAGQHAATDHSQAMHPVLGTSIVRAFGVTAGATGVNMKMAKQLDIKATSVIVRSMSHAEYYPGAEQILIKLVYDPYTGKILGAQIAGGEGVDKRIDVIATAMQFGGTVRDLAEVDLAYAPPFGNAKDPVHMAAFAASNVMDGLITFTEPGANLEGKQLVNVFPDHTMAVKLLPGIKHIPIDQLRDRMGELDAGKETVVVCRFGLTSYIGARILAQSGFKKVSDLAGGIIMRSHACPPSGDRG